MKPPLFKFQISLRAGIVCFSLFCLLLGLALINYRTGRFQKLAVSSIQSIGNARIDYDYHLEAGGEARPPLPLHPSWLGRVFGKDYFHRVEGVELINPEPDQIDMLNDFPHLKNLRLKGRVRQADVDAVLRIPKLISLSLTFEEAQYDQSCPIHFDQLALHKTLTEFEFQHGILVDHHWNAISQAPRLEILKLREAEFRLSDPHTLKPANRIQKLYWTAVASGKRKLEVDFLSLLPGLETFVFQANHRLAITDLFIDSGFNAMSLSSIDDTALVMLSKAKNLRELSLFRTEITGQGLAHLSTRQLVTLELPVSHLDDHGMAHLEKFPFLEFLEIGSTDITDLGMNSLANLSNLQTLSIRDTAVGDVGLQALQNLSSLELLRLRDTKISERAIQAFREANPVCVIDKL